MYNVRDLVYDGMASHFVFFDPWYDGENNGEVSLFVHHEKDNPG